MRNGVQAIDMSRVRDGVQAIEEPQGFYIHCLAHSLNLCVGTGKSPHLS